MADVTYGADAPKAGSTVNQFYFVAWRWHFYAGLYVVPFLVMLATTGLIMLWISWSAGIGSERMPVTPQGDLRAVSELQAAAEAAVPGGTAVQYIEPLEADRVAVLAIGHGDDETGVAVNPYTAEVLQTFPWRAGWYDVVNKIHGTLLLGALGDRMIEIAASLAIVMIATGLYLHWPRNGSTWRGVFLPRLRAPGRAFWKSLHGVLGMWISAILVVFLISGLSWSGVWGEKIVQAWNTFPAEKYAAPVSDATHASMNHDGHHEVPWALEKAPMPASGSLAGNDAIFGDVTIDSVAAFARDLGFIGRFQVNFPSGEGGVWTVSHDSMSNDGPDPAADRTIHLDQYTGNVLADVRYADYSPYAKAMAWGIAFHEGDLGIWNLLLNTLFCLSVVTVSVSGIVMWWKRRPKSAPRLAAPPRPRDLPFWKGAAVMVVILGVAFPMAGFAIVAVLLIDVIALRFMPGLRQALS